MAIIFTIAVTDHERKPKKLCWGGGKCQKGFVRVFYERLVVKSKYI